jgi:hypothetical protein
MEQPLETAIACNLTSSEQRIRQDDNKVLIQSAQQILEIQDGYAFGFADDSYTQAITDFILRERRCCPFYLFELSFNTQQGMVWLQIRGSQEVKTFLREMLSPLCLH